MGWSKSIGIAIVGFVAVFAIDATPAHAVTGNTLTDLQKKIAAEEEKARTSFIDDFIRFTTDKNVMGRAADPSGKVQLPANKTSFNADDGQNYRSDLTFHNRTEDWWEDPPKDPRDPSKQLDPNAVSVEYTAGLSEHGKIASGGGSSILERVPTELNDKFKKKDEDQAKRDARRNKTKPDDGIRYDGLFKIETQNVPGPPKPNPDPSKPAPKPDMIAVERKTIRDEAIEDIRKVGTDSASTVIAAAKEKNKGNDPKELPDGVLLRYASGKATEAMWQVSLKNLGQRRINERMGWKNEEQMETGRPTCAANVDAMRAKDPELKDQQTTAKRRAEIQKGYDEKVATCEKFSNTDYAMINPTEKRDDKDKPTGEIGAGEMQYEDGMERDERVQLTTMANTSTDATKVTSNWKYGKKDTVSKVEVVDENGQTSMVERTAQEQVDAWNQGLQRVADAEKKIEAEIPGYKFSGNPLAYQIKEGTSMLEINRPPDGAFSDAGFKGAPQLKVPARNYTELVKQNTQGSPQL